jgi:hypothetical protein
MNRVIIQYVILWALLTSTAISETRRVPADYQTIQAAIDACVDGDVVLVSPGTYTGYGNRDIDFKGKAITVKSEQGPRTCIIDCQGTQDEYHRGFYFHSGEDADSILDGFTLTGGYHDYAAAINYDRSNPRIVNCIMQGNTGEVMSLFRSDACLSNNLIIGNRGRAIACTHNNPVFLGCTTVSNRGEGLYSDGGKGEISLKNCIITGNVVPFVWVGPPPPLSPPRGAQVHIGGCSKQPGCMSIDIKSCCIDDDPNAIFVEAWPDPSESPVSGYIKAEPLFANPGYWDPNGTPDNPNNDFLGRRRLSLEITGGTLGAYNTGLDQR